MPREPESLGEGVGPILADMIPLMPSGARRAGAARVMAARVGVEPSVLVNHPYLTQLLAMGAGAVGNAYTEDQGLPTRIAATAGPIVLTQLLRHLELRSIQKKYDKEERKRLQELDEESLLGASGIFGVNGSTRLGSVAAYEAMRNRKYKSFGPLSEAGDAIFLASAGINPALGLPAAAVVSEIDNRAADELLKQSDFTDQSNVPTVPLYLAAALASSLGLSAAGKIAVSEMRNTQPLGTDNWARTVADVSGTEPLMLASEGTNNAFFYKPQSEGEALSFLHDYAKNLTDVTPQAPTRKAPAGLYAAEKEKLQRMLRSGVIVADSTAGAPVVAHEAGHAKVEETPGVIRFLQRHLYPHQNWITPLAGAGSMAAGLASGGALKGGLIGTGIGLVSGLGQIAPEMAASYYGMKGLGGGKLGEEGKKDLLAALSTYLTFGVLPSTLSGAAGGWIASQRKKKEVEEAEEHTKIANVDTWRKMFRALQNVKKNGMSGDLADSYTRGLFDRNYLPLKRGFYQIPELVAMGLHRRMKPQQVESLLDAWKPPVTESISPPTPPVLQQGLLDLFKEGQNKVANY